MLCFLLDDVVVIEDDMSRDERRVEASPLFLEIKEGLLVSFEDVLHLRLCFLLEDRSMTRLKGNLCCHRKRHR